MKRELRPISSYPVPAPLAWQDPNFFAHASEEAQTGLRYVGRKLWWHKWLIVGVTLCVVAASGVVCALMIPHYSAESRVLVGVQAPRVLNGDESVLGGITANAETVQSEAYIIKSHPTAEKVVRRLDLDKLPEFNATLRAKPYFDFSKWLGIDMVKSWAKSWLRTSKVGNRARERGVSLEQGIWDGVVGALLKHVQVETLNRSHVLSIDAESQDPQLAARIANSFADVYIEQQLKTKNAATGKVDQWLSQRIAKLKKEIEKADTAVATYRRKHNLYETKSDTVVAQQLVQMNRELLAAQNAKVDAQSRYRQAEQAKAQLNNSDAMESLPAVLDSRLIQTLRSQQSQLEQKAAQLASIYTAKHPLRRDVAAQIKEVRAKIRAEAQRIVNGLSHQVKMADDRYSRINQQMAAIQSKMGASNEETIRLRELQRVADADRDMLVALLQRSQQTVGQQSLLTPDSRIISKAEVPLSPSFPPTRLILVLAALIGAGGGTLLALLLEGVDQTFRARVDVERETGLPLLALVPSVSKRRRSAIDSRAPFWDSLHMLNTRLSLENGANPGAGKISGSVMFTSALPGEAKTTLSTAYARLLAQCGQRVVIVELDWKRPNLHKALGQGQQAGLAELLHGHITPEEAVYRDPETGLHAIFAGNGGYILGSDVWLARLRLLLGTLSRHYDVIIMDTAPVSVAPEILHVSQLVEQTVFVVKWGSTPRQAVLTELASLRRAGAHLGGMVLSRVDMRRYHRYAYGEDDYSYHKALAFGAAG